MYKSEKSSEEPPDRLSDLPDSLIYEIFWLLPMREVVRTTILSKRWEDLWTTTPYLNFDSYHDSINGYHDSEFVNRALALWRGFKILKFKIGFGFPRNSSVFRDINSWVRLAKDHGVEELYLLDTGVLKLSEPCELSSELYCVPQNLYSCSTLKVLSLRGCNLKIGGNGNVQWNQLRSLTIGIVFIDKHSIDQVVSGSPKLEVLVLDAWERGNNLSIRSGSLRKLSIEKKEYCSFDDRCAATELKIWSPNLETLDITGLPFGKYSLMNVTSLNHLTLDFCCYFRRAGFLDEILGTIFPSIQHVEKVTMSDKCIKMLVAMKKKYLLSPLSNFKFLTINISGAYERIMDLLQIFPNLETLVLHSVYASQDPVNHDKSLVQYERNIPKSFLLQLKIIEITWVDGDKLIFPLVEFLLKHASKLQKMVFRGTRIKAHKPLMSLRLAVQQKLLRMPRSSPTAELIFVEY